MNDIVFSNLFFAHKSSVIFQGFDFAFPRYQFNCLLGASGIGKTTLLRLIAGGVQPQKGMIGPDLKGQIAWMGQRDLLLPWASVFENIILGKKLRREALDKSSLRIEVQHLLDKVGLQHCLDKKPHELSVGMRQRVALARTLFEDKDIILMDEPFSSVDVVVRRELQQLTAELLRGKTVFMVTHDPLDALSLADCIYVLAGQPIEVIETISLAGETPRKMNQHDLWQLHDVLLEKIRHVHTS